MESMHTLIEQSAVAQTSTLIAPHVTTFEYPEYNTRIYKYKA